MFHNSNCYAVDVKIFFSISLLVGEPLPILLKNTQWKQQKNKTESSTFVSFAFVAMFSSALCFLFLFHCFLTCGTQLKFNFY